MAGKKKGKKKQSKKKQTEASGGTTVNVNVAMTMTNSTDKVKRIRSRRRPNIREMRRRMGPGFYGNVAQLSNNALNTMQNERYALETDIRGLKAQRDVLAGAAAGGVGAGAGAPGANALADINQQIGRLSGQLNSVTANMAKGFEQQTASLRRVKENLREGQAGLEQSIRQTEDELARRSGFSPSGIGLPSDTPIPESAESAGDPSLFGQQYGQQATPAATYASATEPLGDIVEPEPQPEPEQSQASQDVSAAYDSLLASPGVKEKYGQSEAAAYREAEEQRARAESAETQRDALERRESSRLSTVQADAAVGQQELAQSRQRQEQRAQKAEAKLDSQDFEFTRYLQGYAEKNEQLQLDLEAQRKELAKARATEAKFEQLRQTDPEYYRTFEDFQGQLGVTQQDVDEEFERIQQGLKQRAQQDLAERADRRFQEALEPSTVRKGPPRSYAKGRKGGAKRAPSGKPGD